MKKILDWFRESNRYKHAWAGLFVYAFMILVGLMLLIPLVESAVVATMSTLVAMASMEYKDKQHGGEYDLSDILAGMVFPALFGLIILIFVLF